ncbi:MAG: hypothetical protein JWQ79_1839 [Mucilaginibacter sp.]|nr:hypothetical protein [Mucilaginibacter sp.]
MKYFISAVVFILVTLTTNVHSQQGQSDKKFKQEFLDRINRMRRKGCMCGLTRMQPAKPLIWNSLLESAALGHAQDMAANNYFSHNSKDGRTTLNRIENIGYTHNGYKSFTVGENIAQGQQSIAEVIDGWFKSEGHCRNLMNPDFKEVGVAVYNNYWVQDFGGREEFSAEVKQMINSGKYRLIQKSRPAQ